MHTDRIQAEAGVHRTTGATGPGREQSEEEWELSPLRKNWPDTSDRNSSYAAHRPQNLRAYEIILHA